MLQVFGKKSVTDRRNGTLVLHRTVVPFNITQVTIYFLFKSPTVAIFDVDPSSSIV